MAEKLQADGICIPIPVVTRWNSQYYTVAKIVEIPTDKLNVYLKELKKDSLILSQRDITMLNEFVSIFALIAEVSTKIQAEESASISLVAPSLLEIFFDLQSEYTVLKYCGGLCKAMLNSLQDRFGGFFKQFNLSVDNVLRSRSTYELYGDSIFLIAPFLDARFGYRWIMHSKLEEETKVRSCEAIKRLIIKSVLRLHGTQNSENVEVVVEPSTSHPVTTGSSVLKRKSLFAFPKVQEPLGKRPRSSVLGNIEEEILLFSKELSDDGALVLKKATTYPLLNSLALRILCVPATSAPVERVFSTSGFLIRSQRGSLTKEMLAKLTFLKCNSDLIN